MHFAVVDLLFLVDGVTELAGSVNVYTFTALPDCGQAVCWWGPSSHAWAQASGTPSPPGTVWPRSSALPSGTVCVCVREKKNQSRREGGKCVARWLFIFAGLSQSNRLFCGPLVWKEGVPPSWCLLLTERAEIFLSAAVVCRPAF